MPVNNILLVDIELTENAELCRAVAGSTGIGSGALVHARVPVWIGPSDGQYVVGNRVPKIE